MRTSRLVPGALAALCLLAGLTAQRKVDASVDKEKVDPYTGGDAERVNACGYVTFAPFYWADDHHTTDIDNELGPSVRMRWVETEHFKIGVGLLPRAVPNRRDKESWRRLTGELERLREKLPKERKRRQVPKRPKQLDTWLLTHLFAQRLEDLYEDFRARVVFEEPPHPDPGKLGADGRGWRAKGGLGAGSYLGQHGKYCVLILERQSDLSRYLQKFCGRDENIGVSHQFFESNSLIYATAAEVNKGALKAEPAMHCNVIFGVTRNLVDGYRGYTYEVPVWWKEGLAHWYRRKVDKRFNTFTNIADNQHGRIQDTDWGAKVLRRVEVGIHPSAADLTRWKVNEIGEFDKHVMVWSRVDFLMSFGDEKFRAFMGQLKGLPTTGVPFDKVLETQDKALEEVYGIDLDEFDTQWVDYVKREYRQKGRRR